MEIMVETVFRIMKALNYYPRFVLREVEPASFNYPEQSSTRGGGYSGHASALIEEEDAGFWERSPYMRRSSPFWGQDLAFHFGERKG